MDFETAFHEKSLSVTRVLIKQLVQTLNLSTNSNLVEATELVLESFDKIELFVLNFIKNEKFNKNSNTIQPKKVTTIPKSLETVKSTPIIINNIEHNEISVEN